MRNLQDYEEVKERLPRFWEQFPDGAVRTVLLEWRDDQFAVQALLFRHADDELPMATGLAHERLGGQGANKDAALENCETSAIGRALANGTFASDKKPRPSREEMRKVEQPSLKETVWKFLQAAEVEPKRFIDFIGVEFAAEKWDDLTDNDRAALSHMVDDGSLLGRLVR